MESAWRTDWNSLELGERLGAGTYGNVLRGVLMGTYDVAVKIMSNTHDVKLESEPEIKFLKRARHRKLVWFMGCGQIENKKGNDLFVVLEYMNTGDLSTFLWASKRKAKSTPDPSWATRISLLKDAAEGMTYLHQMLDKLHRDLKSPNILLTKEKSGRLVAKVADFGLSTSIRETRRRANTLSTKTDDSDRATSSVLHTAGRGTLRWMAPEMITVQYGKLQAYDKAVDVFSFGVILWEALELMMPWSHTPKVLKCGAMSMFDLVLKRGERPKITPSLERVAPKGFVALLKECWRYDAADRPIFRDILFRLQDMEVEMSRTQQHAGRCVVRVENASSSKTGEGMIDSDASAMAMDLLQNLEDVGRRHSSVDNNGAAAMAHKDEDEEKYVGNDQLEEMLHDEAFQEWQDRGYEPLDFSLQKMMEIWEKEQLEEMENKRAAGKVALRDKMDLIEAQRGTDRTKFLKTVRDGIRSTVKQTKAEVVSAVVDTFEVLEPRFLRNIRLRHAFRRKLRKEEKKEKSKVEKIEAIRTAKHQMLQIEKKREEIKQEKHVRRAPFVKKVEKDEQENIQKIKLAEAIAYKERRQKVIAEEENRKRREEIVRKQTEVENTRRRRKDAVKNLRQYAAQQQRTLENSTTSDSSVSKRQKELAAKEWRREKKNHAKLLRRQQFPKGQSARAHPLGVFGVPMGGTSHLMTADRQLNDRNPSTVQIFHPTNQTKDAEMRIRLQNLESKQIRLEGRIGRTKGECVELSDQIHMTQERILKLDDDIHEIDRVDRQLDRSLAGPPGRLPSEAEILARHARKRKRFFLFRNQCELEQKKETMKASLISKRR
eukprot:g5108.t1